jgi:hypothetical protein
LALFGNFIYTELHPLEERGLLAEIDQKGKPAALTRHDILMPYVLNRCPTAVPKDRDRRPLTMAQKIAI